VVADSSLVCFFVIAVVAIGFVYQREAEGGHVPGTAGAG
jgi:hypothetical protein